MRDINHRIYLGIIFGPRRFSRVFFSLHFHSRFSPIPNPMGALTFQFSNSAWLNLT